MDIPPGQQIVDRSFRDLCGPQVREVFTYWDRLRGSRLMPRREEVDPAEVKRHIAGMLIVEVVPLGPNAFDYVYRLVGTREVEARGLDPTNLSVRQNWYGSSLERVLWNYETVRRGRTFLYDSEPVLSPTGRVVEDETLFMPLSDDGERVADILIYSHYREAARG